MPKINSGLSAMSRPTDSSRNMNGVRESPAPRSTAIVNAYMNMNGIATKMMRR